MEASPLRLRQTLQEEVIECWDDDEDLQCNDDIHFRTVSAGTSVTGSSSIRPSGHRDSISSRRSCRSDLDSNGGDEEDWQLLLHDNDESATRDAIASAKNAGIPLPADIPKSALLGGTIKRLGGRKIKKAIRDDWSEDLELSGIEGELELKLNRKETFPDTLRQLSSFPDSSPTKRRDSDPFISDSASPSPPSKSIFANLERFRDTEDDSSFHDVPTIKIAKSRPQQTILPPPTKPAEEDENFEDDLEFPPDGGPLKLSTRKDIVKTPDLSFDDFDSEWAEGSIGVRFGGTKRDGFSARSSTVSALSPSLSSCLTAESEDDGLDGLLLPDGPLDLEQAVKKRLQQSQLPHSPPTSIPKQSPKRAPTPKDDFFSGIEIGDGEVFDSGKLTLNRNIKRKTTRPISPARRTATSITFTNKPPVPPTTRIPRLSGHERPHSTHLEPVSESGAPVPKYRRPHSRLSGHGTHSSLSNIPLPSQSMMPPNPPTPSRRSLGGRGSGDTIRSAPTTTNAQLLKAKRSVPTMRNVHSSGTIPSIPRPPSRQDGSIRQTPSARPKTPIDRPNVESRLSGSRRPPVPFLPAGASQNQSHHVNVKTPRHYRRTDSESSSDLFSNPRSTSRLSNQDRADTPGRPRFDLGPEALAASAKHTITKPNRRRNFGDGSELDIFDDLPTSATLESKFVKYPIGRGAPRSIRSRLSQSHIVAPPMADIPVSQASSSPTRGEFTPRFARDTNASRNAREQRIASMTFNSQTRDSVPLGPLSTNWKSQTSVRPLTSPTLIRNRRGKGSGDGRPHLIKAMGTGVQEPKSVKGMRYNPTTYKWEGNENATVEFEAVPSPKSPKVAPALITNVGASSGVQVVGGMVFDPQRMCWLKVASSQGGRETVTLAPDEEDVLAGLDDLDERPQRSTNVSKRGSLADAGALDGIANLEDKSGGESSDEWPITEEFDVGPEFIKRQRAEEEKWRRKVTKWVTEDRKTLGDGWRWAIRDMVRSDISADAHQMGRN